MRTRVGRAIRITKHKTRRVTLPLATSIQRAWVRRRCTSNLHRKQQSIHRGRGAFSQSCVSSSVGSVCRAFSHGRAPTAVTRNHARNHARNLHVPNSTLYTPRTERKTNKRNAETLPKPPPSGRVCDGPLRSLCAAPAAKVLPKWSLYTTYILNTYTARPCAYTRCTKVTIYARALNNHRASPCLLLTPGS